MFRTSKHLGRWLAIAVAIGVACCAVALAAKPPKPPPQEPPAYTIVPFVSPFPAPDGYNSGGSRVYDLNECGQAVGREEFSDGSSPTVHQALHLDIVTDTYTLLQGGGFPLGVNNLNRIVGARLLSDGRYAGMFWKAPNGAPVDLPPLVNLGHTQSGPEAINDAGVVVGYSWNDDETSVSAAIWIVQVADDAVLVYGPWDLPPLAGDARAEAVSLNEVIGGSCKVTGASWGADESYEAVVWTVTVDGTTATPGPAVSLVDNNAWSVGSGINDPGDVCGLVGVGNKSMPFLAPAGQTAQLLPVPRNTQYGCAWDVNNLGEVVGHLDIYKTTGFVAGPGCFYAYLWKNGNPVDLNTQIDPDSGWGRLWAAERINDPGIIAGFGRFDVEWRGFLLIPNP